MRWPDLRLDWLRGLRAALILGGLGAIAPFLMILSLTVCGWVVFGATESDRRSDLVWLPSRMLGPAVGILFAATGWATFAPRVANRFLPTFLILCLVSVGSWSWLALEHIQHTPRRLKGVDHPLFSPSEFLILLGPPIAAAACLSLQRAANESKSL